MFRERPVCELLRRTYINGVTFRLEAGAPLDSELRRVAGAELDAALADLENDELSCDERVHETRKHIKKLRALLALVRARIGQPTFRRLDDALRNVAHGLGGLRERAALRESLDALLERGGHPGLADLRAHIAGDPQPVLGTEALLDAAEGLRRIRAMLDDVALDVRGWDDLAEDFRRTYKAGRKALARALEQPDAERLHALRRHAKRHQHQLTLLEAIWPGPLGALRKELSTLGDELGDHHDLALLVEHVSQLELPEALAPLRGRFEALAAERSRELEALALARAARLFAERARRLSRRFGAYFSLWQREAQSGATIS